MQTYRLDDSQTLAGPKFRYTDIGSLVHFFSQSPADPGQPIYNNNNNIAFCPKQVGVG
jgi:hypothetical protein